MSLYWNFENNNRFSKSKYSFEEAEKLNRTLVNCSDCVNCSWCLDKDNLTDIHEAKWK